MLYPPVLVVEKEHAQMLCVFPAPEPCTIQIFGAKLLNCSREPQAVQALQCDLLADHNPWWSGRMHGYTWLRPEAQAQVSHAEVPVRGQPTGLAL